MQRANTDFLSNDAEIVLGFLELTEAAVIEDDKIRRRAEARRAYQAILKYITRIHLTKEQRSALMQRLSRVRGRLWL
jgi:TnpA family transposase